MVYCDCGASRRETTRRGKRYAMIRENQKVLSHLNVISDGIIIFPMLPLAYWIRFGLLPHAASSIPLSGYLWLDVFYTLFQLFTIAALGLYHTFRRRSLRRELVALLGAIALDILLLVSVLYLFHAMNYSRLTLAIFCALSWVGLSVKRAAVRQWMRRASRSEANQKRVLVLGAGKAARRYLEEIDRSREFGYRAIGYLADDASEDMAGAAYLGTLDRMEQVLEQYRPDEVVSAVGEDEFRFMAHIVELCESFGVRLAIIPYYADYIPAHPQFDDLNGIPLMNIRYIPLDNWRNAFVKRAMDVAGSAVLLLLTSPLMLLCAVGVRLSSPGPIFFRQERIGLNKKPFYMYKFRSMRLNDRTETGWSGKSDDRRTPFGSFIRKFSLDELPQFWNVLRGDMSLVGPRPEVPYYVEQFKKEVPLYMVKHQVRPGITGWAQVNGLRGDTSIRERIEHDVYYIEHWSVLFDIKILFMTMFKGKFVNDEKL